MRFASALLIAGLLAAPIAAQPARAPARAAVADWSTRLALTPQGGILLGNPNAPVKLVEFGSLTCPHCRAFHSEGLPVIKGRWLAAGQVSYEYRSFSLNGIDLMAGLLLQCQAAPQAWAFVNRVYARQDELVSPFMTIPEAERARIQGLASDAQGPAMAVAGKLPEFAAAAGLPRARYDACIAAKPAMERLLAIRADAVQNHQLQGTPSFLINGRMQTDVFDWAALEPLIDAAIKAAPQRK
ncbi:thioredoxin domain-containing protein [Sandarakinorhabdus sp. AAP62]|uniref:thioredoxin domain-containing protein n=1 Tax=Sandarakinorhabdus sp. AAP62 TaxID=1248916 RepID=UPI0003169BD9|nr:thioredoxin domain-containing protein [Sandarakinorhabdus sp. AAP62]